MDDTAFVRRVESIGDLPCDRERIPNPGSGIPSMKAIGKRFSLHQLQYQRAYAVCILEPVNRADVRVIERREQARLAFESCGSCRIAGEVIRKYLDRHIARKLYVARLVDLTHPPGAERREDFVRAETSARRKRHRYLVS